MHTTTYKIDDQERPTVYSKGNFIQYSLVTYLGENLYCTPETSTMSESNVLQYNIKILKNWHTFSALFPRTCGRNN